MILQVFIVNIFIYKIMNKVTKNCISKLESRYLTHENN